MGGGGGGGHAITVNIKWQSIRMYDCSLGAHLTPRLIVQKLFVYTKVFIAQRICTKNLTKNPKLVTNQLCTGGSSYAPLQKVG